MTLSLHGLQALKQSVNSATRSTQDKTDTFTVPLSSTSRINVTTQIMQAKRYLRWFALPTHHEHDPLIQLSGLLRGTVVLQCQYTFQETFYNVYTDGTSLWTDAPHC